MNTKLILKNILYISTTVLITGLVVFTITNAGSLSPTVSPSSTMYSTQELWDIIAGDKDTSSIIADRDGNVLERLEYLIEQ